MIILGGGGEGSRKRRRGRARDRSVPSTLPDGLAVREVGRDAEGRGRTWSEALLKRLMRSLKEGCRDLIEGTVGEPLADGPPKVGESEVERWAGRLVREESRTFAGSGDTRSLSLAYWVAMLLLLAPGNPSPCPVLGAIAATPSPGR